MSKIKIIRLFDVNFHNLTFDEISSMFNKKKLLICVPSGPGLETINYDPAYKNSLMNSDVNIFDSSLFVLLLKLLRLKVDKYSGLLFFADFIKYLKLNHINSYMLIDPSIYQSTINYNYMNSHACSSLIKPYVAPFYKSDDVKDISLLDLIHSKRPKFIIINLGGGIQEKLGAWLKNKLNYKATIICTGAAISFYTGYQALIPNYIDRLYLGWLARCIQTPSIFIPRYLKAFKFIKFFLDNRNNIKIILSKVQNDDLR